MHVSVTPPAVPLRSPRRSSIMGGLLIVAALLGAPCVLTGCNTVEGLGEDLSAGGEAISGASREVRSENRN